MKIKQEQEEVLSCHGHAILLNAVVNDKRYNQSLGLRRTKYFFLILRRVILKDHDALFLTDEVTLHEKMTSHFRHISRNKLTHSQITSYVLNFVDNSAPM